MHFGVKMPYCNHPKKCMSDNLTMNVRSVTCKNCLSVIKNDVKVAYTNIKENQEKRTGKTHKEIAMERGSRIIKGLPNIDDLRALAKEMHDQAVRLWMEIEGAEDSREYGEILRWGFTSNQLEVIENYKRSLISRLIELEKECNCKGIERRRGDTFSILPDGTEHLSWCERGREYQRKEIEVMEEYA